MEEPTRAGSVAGILAVAVAAAAIAGAALASPAFTVTGNALSDLGQPGNPAATPVTTLLFDGGLVVAGLVGLPFTVVLRRARRHPLEQLAAIPFAAALLGMAGVGLFPAGRSLHVPAALTLYLGSMVAMVLDGIGATLAGVSRRAVATLALVTVHVAGWWWWAAGGAVLRPGLAIPELLGAGVFGWWVVRTARRQLAGLTRVSTSATGPNS
jgi:hypothetical membrane protein